MDKRDSTLESEISRAKKELTRLMAEQAKRNAEARAEKRHTSPWWAWAGLALAAAGVVAVLWWLL